MMLDQTNGTPQNYIVAGADYHVNFARNAAAFNVLDLFIEIVKFTLNICRRINFDLER